MDGGREEGRRDGRTDGGTRAHARMPAPSHARTPGYPHARTLARSRSASYAWRTARDARGRVGLVGMRDMVATCKRAI